VVVVRVRYGRRRRAAVVGVTAAVMLDVEAATVVDGDTVVDVSGR
jgi:hypothetical protein